MKEVDTIETNREAYQTLREEDDKIEEDPAITNVSDYDAIVEVDGDMYGVEFNEGYAQSEKNLREAGVEVYGSREIRGSESAGSLADNLKELTVEEAVNQGLEEDTPQEEVPVDQSPTAGRYGFGKAVSD